MNVHRNVFVSFDCLVNGTVDKAIYGFAERLSMLSYIFVPSGNSK